MTTREKITISLLKPINPSIIIVLGLYTLLWGLWILSPFWTVFTQAPLYSAMAGIASETFWGFTAICSGAVITYGAIKPSFKNITRGAFVGAIHWFIIAIMYFVGDWTSTGGISAAAFCVYSAIVWANVKINRSHFDGSD